MVGMPGVAVCESRQRMKSNLTNSGFGYPNKRITINLAPANVRKDGAGFDLPVAFREAGTMRNPSSLTANRCSGFVWTISSSMLRQVLGHVEDRKLSELSPKVEGLKESHPSA